MARSETATFELGADVIRLLIPHRRPFLMVDRVTSFESGATPRLTAERHVSANEPVFEGHYPGLHLWPGVYTIEGLGQTSMLLESLLFLERQAAARGAETGELVAALKNLELGYRLHRGFKPDGSSLLRELASLKPPLALSGSLEMKFIEPVFAGSLLEYEVVRQQLFEQRFVRFAVEARVASKTVAKGSMTGVIGPGLFPDAPPQ
jgi:3-hydroxyacyl-[acyl-carrier-protein] dehydratase